jgi:putative ABC transport system permease protein
MFGYSWKFAVRTLLRNKAYAFLNVLGLTLGMALVIGLFWILRFERSFDMNQAGADRTYQIRSYNKFGEMESWVPPGLVNTVREQLPAVQTITQVYEWTPQVIRVGNQNFQQPHTFFVAQDFFHLIPFEWVEGNPQTALSQPFQVVLDEPTAQKLFHGEAMGKTIRFENQLNLTVTGIVKKAPVNTDFPMAMLVSYATLNSFQAWMTNPTYWGGGDGGDHAYLILKQGVSPAAIESQMNAFAAQHKDNSDYVRFELKPITQIHFDMDSVPFNYHMPLWLWYALGTIGLFIILIASINFVNMATVQAIQRSKEIGMRKILGSGKGRIVMQFFMETFLIVGAAMVLGAFLADAGMPYAGQVLDTQAAFGSHWNVGTVGFLLLLWVSITLIAGAYPALVLSGFQPMQMLRKHFTTPRAGGISLRKVLVITQFVIAQVLVICTLMGIRQIRYFYHVDPGFNKSNVYTAPMPDRGSPVLRARLKQSLLAHPEVEEVSYGLSTPSTPDGTKWIRAVHYAGLPKGAETFRLQFTDTDYQHFFRIPIIAGRPFEVSDTAGQVMINETAARNMGFADPSKAIGVKFKADYIDGELQVVGVVRDFQSQSVKGTIEPHLMVYDPDKMESLFVRTKPGYDKEALGAMEEAWRNVFPDNVFSYTYLSDSMMGYYQAETKLARLLSLFAIIGISIGCMGLFGLVAYVCAQRTKEIGIRKVLGATVSQILTWITRDFVYLVAIAGFIAFPLGWYLMHLFLNNYAYKAPIDPWIFVLTGVISISIALVTVSFHAIRAALTKPISSLRSEG